MTRRLQVAQKTSPFARLIAANHATIWDKSANTPTTAESRHGGCPRGSPPSAAGDRPKPEFLPLRSLSRRKGRVIGSESGDFGRGQLASHVAHFLMSALARLEGQYLIEQVAFILPRQVRHLDISRDTIFAMACGTLLDGELPRLRKRRTGDKERSQRQANDQVPSSRPTRLTTPLWSTVPPSQLPATELPASSSGQATAPAPAAEVVAHHSANRERG